MTGELCAYPRCNKPVSGRRSKYCSSNCTTKVSQNKRREERTQYERERILSVRGRQCKWCSMRDSDKRARWHHLTECDACLRKTERRPRCEGCGGPRTSYQHMQLPYVLCVRCDDRPPELGELLMLSPLGDGRERVLWWPWGRIHRTIPKYESAGWVVEAGDNPIVVTPTLEGWCKWRS